MKINVVQQSDKTIFELSGRLDTVTSPKLQEVLIPEFGSTAHVVIDMLNLDYVSSAGLRILLMGQKTAKTMGSKQTIINVSEDIMEVFEMTGFSDILNLE